MNDDGQTTWYRRFGKRALDISISLLLLLILSPMLIAIALIAAIANWGNPFFLQVRPGLHGKPFTIVKLKTMKDARNPDGTLLPDEERITAAGRIIRKLSFDELFQLINVLHGDMSLIGPRPLLMQYLPRYSAFEARRHEVRPGISGLAQIKGRNSLSWSRKFRYDVFYVDHFSWSFDLKLVWMTLLKLLKADGINPSGCSNAEYEFQGSERD